MEDINLFIYESEDDTYVIEVLDEDGEDADIVVEGDDFGDALRHAIYEISPVLAASAWTKDYFDWHEEHQFGSEEDEEE